LGWFVFSPLPHPQVILTSIGFYVLDSMTPNQLILGPFHGKVACQTISFGKGVCGTAAQKVETQLVPDVEKFPGHIACDGESKSEIVVPILMLIVLLREDLMRLIKRV
jgi:L-methionine (R)-S-oxide reductase